MVYSGVLRSEDNKEPKKEDNKNDVPEDSKVPKGFEHIEHIIKRARGQKPSSKEEEKKDEKENKEEELTEEEHERGERESKKSKDSKSKTGEGASDKLKNFFMDPNNGGPRWESWLALGLFASTVGATFYFKKPHSAEITYMDFVQNYL